MKIPDEKLSLSASLLTVEFESRGKMSLHPQAADIDEQSIPEWTKFSTMPCPGNIEHGPAINYCRFGVEIEKLVQYFSGIESIESGKLTMKLDESLELHFTSDAQTIFYNSLWYILLYSNCSVFKYGQWARRNYIPSSEPDKLFYMLFSIFLVEDFVLSPNVPPNIDKFKIQLNTLHNVLTNLLERLRQKPDLRSDAVSNGLIHFDSLLQLLKIDFNEFYANLEKKMKNKELEKWV